MKHLQKINLIFSFFTFCFLFPVFVSASYQDVFFSEIQWMWTTKSSADEWIELKNSTDSDINLTWRVLKTEDLSLNISLSWVIKSWWYFLLERTDDNSAYQVEWDLIYSWSLWNSWEWLLLIDSNWNIVDKIDNGSWQAWNSSERKSMLKDENWNWVDWEVDWDPQSWKSWNNWEDLWNNLQSWNWQEWQNWQNSESENQDSGNENDTGSFLNYSFKNFTFEFQRPSYVLEEFNLSNEFYTCDPEKDDCKINFDFEWIISEENFNWQNFSKSDFYCQLKFGSLSTWEENKCNPNTVIFPIWETEVSVKIFKKNNSWEDFLILDKKILIKNFEKESEENNNISNSISSYSSVEKKDLSLKQWISKEKFRIKKISLNETDWDFVEIFCENCDSKTNIWWYKIYSSKNFFYFPIQKFWKYDFSNQRSMKVFLKKDCKNFENEDKNENATLDKNDKNNLNIEIDNLDKADIIKNKFKNPNFCTYLKTWLVSTNWSLFLMNSVWEILDSVCWQNWKEIKWKTLTEINILKNNNLWKWNCLNTDSLKRWDIFERENFSGYNQSSSWKKFNTGDLWNEEILEIEKVDGVVIPVKTGVQEKWDIKLVKETGSPPTREWQNELWLDIIDNAKLGQKIKSDLEIKLEETRKKILEKERLKEKEKIEQKILFNKKTKFYKIYLPKERSRVFRIRWRTLPFIRVKFLSELWEQFEIISDWKWYFKIYFDKLKKWQKIFNVEFFKNWKKVFQKKLKFFLEKDWFSSEYKKKISSFKDKGNEKNKEWFTEKSLENNENKLDNENLEEKFSNPIFKKILEQKDNFKEKIKNDKKFLNWQKWQNWQKIQNNFNENEKIDSNYELEVNPVKKIWDEIKKIKNFIKNFFNF